MKKKLYFTMAAIFIIVLCGCSNEDVDDLAFDKVDDLSFGVV